MQLFDDRAYVMTWCDSFRHYVYVLKSLLADPNCVPSFKHRVKEVIPPPKFIAPDAVRHTKFDSTHKQLVTNFIRS